MLEPWLKKWIAPLEAEVLRAGLDEDPAHDLSHVRRVVHTAIRLAKLEDAEAGVVLPAAYLHDIVNVPKNHPQRKQASRLAGESAVKFLAAQGYPEKYLENIRGSIESHSYSAKIEPKTIEAKCVQDADRLDALGAIGIVRCFTVGTEIKRRFYDFDDPFAKSRKLDDLSFTLDHFYVKLLHIAETLTTKAGRLEGYRRLEFMHDFIKNFEREITLESGIIE